MYYSFTDTKLNSFASCFLFWKNVSANFDFCIRVELRLVFDGSFTNADKLTVSRRVFVYFLSTSATDRQLKKTKIPKNNSLRHKIGVTWLGLTNQTCSKIRDLTLFPMSTRGLAVLERPTVL